MLAMLIWEELDLTPAKVSPYMPLIFDAPAAHPSPPCPHLPCPRFQVVELLARTGCRMGTLLRLGDMSDNVHTSSDEAGANRFSASDVLAFIDRCTAGPEAYLANLSLALEAGLLKLSDKVRMTEYLTFSDSHHHYHHHHTTRPGHREGHI